MTDGNKYLHYVRPLTNSNLYHQHRSTFQKCTCTQGSFWVSEWAVYSNTAPGDNKRSGIPKWHIMPMAWNIHSTIFTWWSGYSHLKYPMWTKPQVFWVYSKYHPTLATSRVGRVWLLLNNTFLIFWHNCHYLLLPIPEGEL